MVSARPGDQAVPYALATRWLRALVALGGPPPDARLRATLAALMPEWADAATPERLADPSPRLRAAAQQLLDAAIGRGLRALLLDDLHHADGASIELLQGLPGSGMGSGTGSGTGPGTCACLLALRPGEGDATLLAWVQALQQAASTQVLMLAALDAPAVQRLVASVGAPPWAGETQARALHRHTGGNPLFVLETVKALPDPATAPAAWPLAHTVLRLIQLRLARLSTAARQVARCVAILGQDSTAAQVARLLSQHPLALASALAASLGRLSEAAQLAEQGAHILQDHGQRRAAFDAWLRAADHYSEVLDLTAFDRAEQALVALADDEGQQAGAACATFFRLYQARDIGQARQVVLAALPKAQAAGLAELEVELLWQLTALAWYEYDEALARLDAVDPATARLGPVTRRLQITEALALLASSGGHMDEGRGRYCQCFTLARQLGRNKSAMSAAHDLALDFGDAQDSRHWLANVQALRAQVDADDAMAQVWALQVGLRVLPVLGALGDALALSDQAAAFCARDRSRYTVGLALSCQQLQQELGRADLARQGARLLAARDDLAPEEKARLCALQLALQVPVDPGPLLADCGQKHNLGLRARLLCRAPPGLAPQAVLPLLTQAAAEAQAQAQGAQGLHLMLQASRLAALRAAGPEGADDPALARLLWAQLAQGLIAPVSYPRIAAQLCATLAPTHPDPAQTIALRAGAWMLNAAATLPPAWRHNYLSRAPLLQALPPRQRGLLFNLAGAAAPPAAAVP